VGNRCAEKGSNEIFAQLSAGSATVGQVLPAFTPFTLHITLANLLLAMFYLASICIPHKVKWGYKFRQLICDLL
jgi:hypothetical protein